MNYLTTFKLLAFLRELHVLRGEYLLTFLITLSSYCIILLSTKIMFYRLSALKKNENGIDSGPKRAIKIFFNIVILTPLFRAII